MTQQTPKTTKRQSHIRRNSQESHKEDPINMDIESEVHTLSEIALGKEKRNATVHGTVNYFSRGTSER